MKEYTLGVDVGSISSKCVVIDEKENIIFKDYIMTEGNPIQAVKNLIKKLKEELPKDIKITKIGTTGSARYLIGKMLNASIIKNEITAHAIGSKKILPEVRTILEIGGQDSKIILLKNGVVVDYAMNTLCAAGTGAFLSSQAKRLGINVEEIGKLAETSKNPSKIAARCTVFAESDLVHKLQVGHKKEDILAGLCNSVVANYLMNVGKGKKIEEPIMFQGGVSKNTGVVKAFEKALGKKVYVDKNGHLMGAYGMALLAKAQKETKKTELSLDNILHAKFETTSISCHKCPNQCEIILFKKEGKIIDYLGNRCENGIKIKITS